MDESKTLDARVYGTPHSSEPSTIADPDAEIVVYPTDERYEQRKTIGEGGMGEVRLCNDRVIGREVAMKLVLDMHRGRVEMRARFEREARVQGQLEHPAIVPVYDFGRDKDGRAFFTMRRVRGVTLEAVLDELRKGNEEVAKEHTRHKLLAAFVRVCLAIQYASEHGVIHRDLKPANVMLGRHGEVYVLDWGLAKVHGATEWMDTPKPLPDVTGEEPPSSRRGISGVSGSNTEAGSVLGTPHYMSPEQIRGLELDARSDVYALGAILFEILTLVPLHGEGNIAQVLNRAARGADARASVRAPERDVPPELESACVLATMVDPKQRIANARELADSIEAYLSGDRDVALRRELAKVHLDRAREAGARAMVPDAPSTERAEALRENGRAIALAPDDPEALALLVELLTKPPERVPKIVTEIIAREDAEGRRRTMPYVALAFLVTAAGALGFQFLLGVRSMELILAPFLLWSGAAAATYLGYRYDKNPRGYYPYVSGLAGLALGFTTVVHGPYLLVPALTTSIAMGTALSAHTATRRYSTLAFALAASLPVFFDWIGLHPAGARFGNDSMTLTTAAVHMPRDATMAYLASMYLLTILVSSRYAGNYHDTLITERTRNELQAWQLRQLVPDAAARAMRRLPSGDLTATRR